MTPYLLPVDPLDLEVSPGVKVRDMATVAECNAAIFKLEIDITVIAGQISRAEASPGGVRPGWRSRAQAAARWKKQTAKALRQYATTLAGVADTDAKMRRQRLLLDTIRSEIGDTEFNRITAVAKVKHPNLFREVL